MDAHGHIYLLSLFMLLMSLVVAAVFGWDVGGVLSRRRNPEGREPGTGRAAHPLPVWSMWMARIWPIVFGIGQFFGWSYLTRTWS